MCRWSPRECWRSRGERRQEERRRGCRRTAPRESCTTIAAAAATAHALVLICADLIRVYVRRRRSRSRSRSPGPGRLRQQDQDRREEGGGPDGPPSLLLLPLLSDKSSQDQEDQRQVKVRSSRPSSLSGAWPSPLPTLLLGDLETTIEAERGEGREARGEVHRCEINDIDKYRNKIESKVQLLLDSVRQPTR